MSSRYSNIQILKSNTNSVRYIKAPKYPDIPFSDQDIYIETVYGDRLDLIAYDYYKSTDYYWVLMVANNLPGDSIFLTPGVQLRIPADLDNIIADYETLNGL
jgi:hypothetical protein